MSTLTVPPTEADHYLGDLRAPVILVEYGDYECPHTRRAAPWISALLREFGANLCYVYRHYPLDAIHPHATLAVLAAELAAARGKFWELHEKLLSHTKVLSSDLMIELAASVDISEVDLLTQLDDDPEIDHVTHDVVGGEDSGVTSTPAFFFNGARLEGPVSFEILRTNLLHVLSGHRLSA
jgi:protein-disulfide isomerase